MSSRFITTAEEIEAEARASIGHAIEAVENNDYETFMWLVPSVVSPEALSNGTCGTRRTIAAIVQFWADKTGDTTLVNYLTRTSVLNSDAVL